MLLAAIALILRQYNVWSWVKISAKTKEDLCSVSVQSITAGQTLPWRKVPGWRTSTRNTSSASAAPKTWSGGILATNPRTYYGFIPARRVSCGKDFRQNCAVCSKEISLKLLPLLSIILYRV